MQAASVQLTRRVQANGNWEKPARETVWLRAFPNEAAWAGYAMMPILAGMTSSDGSPQGEKKAFSKGLQPPQQPSPRPRDWHEAAHCNEELCAVLCPTTHSTRFRGSTTKTVANQDAAIMVGDYSPSQNPWKSKFILTLRPMLPGMPRTSVFQRVPCLLRVVAT